MKNVMDEAERCWGTTSEVYHATDDKVMQERTIRMMIGNLIRNSLTETALNRVELRRH